MAWSRRLSPLVLALLVWAGTATAGNEWQRPDLAALYERLGSVRLWSLDDGALTGRGRMLLRTLQRADEEGLRPGDYRPPVALARPSVAFDRALTDGLLRYIKDLRDGRPGPRALEPPPYAFPQATDAVAVLRRGLAAEDFAAWLRGLPPANAEYRRLRDALARYRGLVGRHAWEPPAATPKLEQGDAGPAVADLRRRLVLLGDLAAETGDFDPGLTKAVKRFQTRHGLQADGVVGPKTWGELAVPPIDRVRRIALNMERLRWLPDDLGRRHLLVNIAGFQLSGFVDGAEVLRMPVIVGRSGRRTPVLADRVGNLVFRPDWTVPMSIARKDLLPKIKEDPGYLAEKGIRVHAGWSREAPEVDPARVDWQAIRPQALKYVFRQDPGPQNALGLIRFSLANPHDIYMHDTPDRDLFRHNGRAFSSGCIRVADPVALATFLLDGQTREKRLPLDHVPEDSFMAAHASLVEDPAKAWTPEAVRAAMSGDETWRLPLAESMPAHVIYLTAWMAPDGTVHFRDDVYGRDAALAEALNLRPAG